MNERVFVYGYGSTKHIKRPGPDSANEWGLCGAPGGHPLVRDSLPICKRCLNIEAMLAAVPSTEETHK